MLNEWIQKANRGEPVWLGEVRDSFSNAANTIALHLSLTDCAGVVHNFVFPVQKWSTEAEEQFVREYLLANIFNMLSGFAGRELRFYLNSNEPELLDMVNKLRDSFQIDCTKRDGYGKVISISNRICRALYGNDFRLLIDFGQEKILEKHLESVPDSALMERLKRLAHSAGGKLCCGLDIGGTDIKAAVSQNGSLLFTKEFDWDPSRCQTADEILNPILLLLRLLRAGVSCPDSAALNKAMKREATLEEIRSAVDEIEKDGEDSLRGFDSVGVSFPDVVIQNRILGGETPKTLGIRKNAALDYDTEFARMDSIRGRIRQLCSPEASIRIANDGNIAAFTAAVEMACLDNSISDGVFAHSLGTDLGTGWLRPNGDIPPYPLEMYDFMLDLGSYPQRDYLPEDVRSVRNENSGLPDARKYLGQSAAFRLCYEAKPELLSRFLEEKGSILQIRKQPEDMRKACLEFLMQSAADHNPAAEDVFYQIGKNLGQISREIQFLFHPETNCRYVYGRFVKHPDCFKLLQKGCHETCPEVELIAADDTLACSPLMRQLSAKADVTVAQFGQAIGAIYFGLFSNEGSFE